MRELSFEHKKEFLSLLKDFRERYGSQFSVDEIDGFLKLMAHAPEDGMNAYDSHGLPRAVITLKTLLLFAQQINPDRNCLAAIALYR